MHISAVLLRNENPGLYIALMLLFQKIVILILPFLFSRIGFHLIRNNAQTCNKVKLCVV